MSSFPYSISGQITDTDGSTALSNVRVVIRNERTNETLSTNTDSSGDYIFDIANFSSGYSNGDIVTVLVIYTNSEGSLEHTVVEGDGGATDQDITLVDVPASDTLRYFTVQQFYDHNGFTLGGENTPSTNEVVLIGTQVEDELDRMCSTRFSDGAIELSVNYCDATTGWSGSTDAVAIAVSTDDADYRTRTGALDLGKSGTTQAFFTYTNSSVTSRDFRNKYIAFFVKLDSLTGLRTIDNGSAIQVRYGSDSSNYYEKTWYQDGLEIISGWNLFYFKIDDREVTETGAPDASDMTYFQIRFDTAATTTTFTAGTVVIDNIFLVHENHFIDEYFDVTKTRQWDFFLQYKPVDRLVRFLINRADENQDISYDELREEDNEIRVSKDTGRVRIVDLTTSLADGQQIFPSPGANQVRAAYIYGATQVPKEIRKLAIMMTTRDLMHSTVAKAIARGQDSFRSEHFTVLDTQIERILMRYRHLD